MGPAWLKSWVKKSPLLVAIYSKFSWRLHVFIDGWGTRVWTRTREVRTPLGFKLISGLHPAYALMRSGTFEVAETALLRALLAQGDRFIDVGANLGYYTCLSLQEGRPVVAVEPQAQNLACLYGNLKANGWDSGAEVFPVALSDAPGLLPLYGASGPSASLVKGWAGYSSRYMQWVPVNTLDNLLAGRFAGERLVVKIDVEGAEFDLLRGAHALLSRSPRPAWLLEVCLQEFHPEGANPDFLPIFELFHAHGYEAHVVSAVPRQVTIEEIREWWRLRRSGGESFNYLFVEPGTALPARLS